MIEDTNNPAKTPRSRETPDNKRNEWPIREVARATGLTSRTLRHYEQIGLLSPARVAHNGFRFYGDAELARLYRILTLRALALPLAAIKEALRDESSLADAMSAQLALLEERRDHISQQISTIQQTLRAVQERNTMSLEEIFAGFDNAKYEAEVRERWGDAAWERSAARRDAMNDDELRADDARTLDITAALRSAATEGVAPDAEAFQALIAQHHSWVTDHWGGSAPDRMAYLSLADMYVADPRFAATYGGQANAEVIRDAIQRWVEQNLHS